MQPVNPPPRPDPRIVPQTVVGNYPAHVDSGPIDARGRALAMAVRQGLLMIVDAIEVYIGLEVRTATLRKEKR